MGLIVSGVAGLISTPAMSPIGPSTGSGNGTNASAVCPHGVRYLNDAYDIAYLVSTASSTVGATSSAAGSSGLFVTPWPSNIKEDSSLGVTSHSWAHPSGTLVSVSHNPGNVAPSVTGEIKKLSHTSSPVGASNTSSNSPPATARNSDAVGAVSVSVTL